MPYTSKIIKIEQLTQNIKKFIIEKPKNYNFIPGQHTILSINKPELKDKKRPFSMGSSDKDNFLEFIIKIYDESKFRKNLYSINKNLIERKGITKEFDKLKPKDELIIEEPKGKISYKGNGIFIAAGTGINPFFSIMKSLNETERENNSLIYLNKTQKEIISEAELKKLFNNNAIFILSREKKSGYEYGHIDKEFLKNKIKNFNQKFYLCGPFKLVSELKKILIELGAKQENIISEI